MAGCGVNILLLGPGRNRTRMNGDNFGDDPTEKLTVIDHDHRVFSEWPDANCITIDLSQPPFPMLSDSFFHEVHAYEILNLLTGDERSFFAFWREIWRVMVPSGRLLASVPHWQSQWIYAWPAPQRTYTPGLLMYLDQDDHSSAAKADFSELWPRPYNFKSHTTSIWNGGGLFIGMMKC